ncbi:MAG: Cna B-type domain-containing protein [Anaerovoracaceae bacterium]|jgi:LPXTG-motif cell wall-anchored protein
MKRDRRKIYSFILVLALVIGLTPAPTSFAAESSNLEIVNPGADTPNPLPSSLQPGEIWTDKSVEYLGNGEFEITLRAVGKDYPRTTTDTAASLDVILILDTSDSMDETPSGSQKNKLESMKDAAKQAVDILLDVPGQQNRVAVVQFNNIARTEIDFSLSKSDIKEKIGDLQTVPLGTLNIAYTNIQDGFRMGKFLVNDRGEGDKLNGQLRKPIIILMSDGSPTRYDNSLTATSWITQYPANNTSVEWTIRQGMDTKTNGTANNPGDDIDIYTIGIGVGGDSLAIRALQPEEPYKYWSAGSTITGDSWVEILEAFTTISSRLIGYTPISYSLDQSGQPDYTDLIIEDILGDGFELSGTLDTGAGLSKIGNKIQWAIPGNDFNSIPISVTGSSIDAEYVNSVSFTVKLKNDLPEGYYETNQLASGVFNVLEENPFYTEIGLIEQDLDHTGWLTLRLKSISIPITITKQVQGPVSNEARTFTFDLFYDEALSSKINTTPFSITVTGEGTGQDTQTLTIPANEFDNNGKLTVYAKENETAPTHWQYDSLKSFTLDKQTGGQLSFVNKYVPKGTLTVVKEWVGNGPEQDVNFIIQKETSPGVWKDVGEPHTLSSSTNPQWQTTISNLPLDTPLKVVEVSGSIPMDYEVLPTPASIMFTAQQLSQTITIINTYNEPEGKITVVKYWNDNENASGDRPESLQFEYTGPNNITGTFLLTGSSNAAVWTDDFETKVFGSYEFKEIVPDDYRISGSAIQQVTIVKDIPADRHKTITFANEYVTPKGELTVTKQWIGDEEDTTFRPDEITLVLLKDGVSGPSITLPKSGEEDIWSHTFTGLDLGHTYSVEEIAIPDYDVTYSSTEGVQLTKESRTGEIGITNTFKNPKGSITINKTWAEGGVKASVVRPSQITVQLWSGDALISYQVLPKPGDHPWTHTFEGLPLTKEGKAYTITETAEGSDGDKLAQYDQSIVYTGDGGSENGITLDHEKRSGTAEITNTYGKGTIIVIKDWKDKNNPLRERPKTATITLYKLVKEPILVPVEVPVVKEATDMPEPKEEEGTMEVSTMELGTMRLSTENEAAEEDVSNGEGTKGEGSVGADAREEGTEGEGSEQEGAEGQGTEQEGDTDENTDDVGKDVPHVTTEIVYKQQGWRTQKEFVAVKEITRPRTSVVFYDLEMTDEDGNETSYFIEEEEIPFYQTIISDQDGVILTKDNPNGIIKVTNKYTDPKGSLKVSKVWDHGNNPNRPNSAIIVLYGNGWPIAIKTITDEYTFNNLPLGVKYTVKELKVKNYQTSYSTLSYTPVKGESHVESGEIVITNKYIPEVSKLRVTKEWVGKKGAPVKIILSRSYETENGGSVIDESFRKTVILGDANNWSHVFKGLELYGPGGVKYQYSATERGRDLSLYTSENNHTPSLNVGRTANIKIINTYTPDKGQLTITKRWLGEDGQQPMTPPVTSIEAILVVDGVPEEGSMVLTEENNWTIVRSGLNVEKTYSVIETSNMEVFQVDYSPNKIKFNAQNLEKNIIITNQRTVDEPDITVTKTAINTNQVLEDGVAEFQYNILIKNTGNRTLTDLYLIDKVTPGEDATGASITYIPAPDQILEDGSVRFNLSGTLAPNEERHFIYKIKVDKPGTYDNHATAHGTYDGEEYIDEDNETIHVKKPGLSIIKSVIGATSRTGSSGTFNYELRIRNDGEFTLHNVTVQDIMTPPNVSATMVYNYGGALTFSAIDNTFEIGTLEAGGDDIIIAYSVALQGVGTYNNTATVTGLYEDELYGSGTLTDQDHASVRLATSGGGGGGGGGTTPDPDPPIEIIDEEIPLGPIPGDPDEPIILEDEEIPAGSLPKTGGVPAVLFFGAGALLVGSGLVLRRRRMKGN